MADSQQAVPVQSTAHCTPSVLLSIYLFQFHCRRTNEKMPKKKLFEQRRCQISSTILIFVLNRTLLK
jgi:hypothetical protein